MTAPKLPEKLALVVRVDRQPEPRNVNIVGVLADGDGSSPLPIVLLGNYNATQLASDEALATELCVRWNSHAALVAALEKCQRVILQGDVPYRDEVLADARAALGAVKS